MICQALVSSSVISSEGLDGSITPVAGPGKNRLRTVRSDDWCEILCVFLKPRLKWASLYSGTLDLFSGKVMMHSPFRPRFWLLTFMSQMIIASLAPHTSSTFPASAPPALSIPVAQCTKRQGRKKFHSFIHLFLWILRAYCVTHEHQLFPNGVSSPEEKMHFNQITIHICNCKLFVKLLWGSVDCMLLNIWRKMLRPLHILRCSFRAERSIWQRAREWSKRADLGLVITAGTLLISKHCLSSLLWTGTWAECC